LYGSYFARTAIDKADECLLVEGYTDVISLHQAGIENVVASGGTSLTVDQLRLIKKYTNHLTIIYDGDAAGVKAALRGLDMALEEGLDVKLVLIPDNEDPDSYVNKVGTTAFQNFIAANKKDFILFQLEVMLKEAGNDVAKKSEIVNQIADTLSKINKAEDFTKQQDYIRRCAALLKIDEAGLTNLVNKHKRDKLSKEEKKLPFEEKTTTSSSKQAEDDFTGLLNKDEKYERNILRVLLEYGLKEWDENQTIAQYVFTELDGYHFDTPPLENLLEEYRKLYIAGQQPVTKTFLYHPEENVRNLVISITLFPFEVSSKWDEMKESLTKVVKDNSKEDVTTSLGFYKLHKLKKMLDDNQTDMENASFDEYMRLLEIHKHLQEEMKKLTQTLGTVILK
jgi:DNA primase